MQVCSSRFDKFWQDGFPSTRSLFSSSCHQSKTKSLWGNHNSVIFAGAVGMWPSHLIDWSPERLTAHSVQSNSYSYCHCSKLHFQKNTVRTQKRSHMLEEMEPERPLVWSCLLIDLNGNILFCEAGNASLVQVKSGDGISCRLARQPTHGTNQETGGEAPGGSTRVQLYIVACKYGQHKVIIWQFSHIVQTVLVMAKRIIADCMTSSWLWVNLCCYPCKHESESEILSRCFKYPPCLCRSPSKSKRYQSVAAFLTNFSGMAFCRLATSLAPAVTNWISRAFEETTIPVIFAGAVGMWLSHLIDWSPERLTSHSVSNS